MLKNELINAIGTGCCFHKNNGGFVTIFWNASADLHHNKTVAPLLFLGLNVPNSWPVNTYALLRMWSASSRVAVVETYIRENGWNMRLVEPGSDGRG